jgi:hypothetical protein
VAYGFQRSSGSETMSIDLGATGQSELAAGLDFETVLEAYEFEADDEAFYINHAFDSVTATVAGEVVVLTAGADTREDAERELQGVADAYLETRNGRWIRALEAGLDRNERIAEQLQSEVDLIDEQLADGGLTEAATSQLVVSRSIIAGDLSDAMTDRDSFARMLDEGGPVGVVGGPREETGSSVRQLALLVAGILAVVIVAVGQAMLRSPRSPRGS